MTQAGTDTKISLDETVQIVFSLIRQELIDVEQAFLHQLQSNVQIITHIGEYLHDGGGKRIRPALLLLAAKLFGRPAGLSVMRMATVMESLHTATLVHDDIIDGAEVRRGRPSVNRLWGSEVTVLMGDWLYMMAFETSLKERSFEVLDILTSMTRRMTEGELIQLTKIGKLDITVNEYMDIIRRKTAFLFSACTEIGGRLGGASVEQQSSLREFGLNLGIAFQLIDDVLDFTSSESRLGKPAGNDLREGKVTLPLIYLIERGNPSHLRMIETVIQEQDYRTIKRAEFVRTLEEEGVLNQARRLATEYADRARGNLAVIPDGPYKAALLDVARFVVERLK